jgi:thymidine phosphorylase
MARVQQEHAVRPVFDVAIGEGELMPSHNQGAEALATAFLRVGKAHD